MDTFGEVIVSLYGLIIAFFVILIIFLIVKRIKAKKQEDFEKRDN